MVIPIHPFDDKDDFKPVEGISELFMSKPVIFASSDYLLTSTGGIFWKKARLMKQSEVFGHKFVSTKP